MLAGTRARVLACCKQSLFCSKTCERAASCAGAQCAVPTFIKLAQFRQELETARCLVYSPGLHFHVRDSSSIKIVGDLWTASARGWGWAVESESSHRSGGGGGSPGEQGAGGVRETREERAGSRIEIQKGKLSLFVLIIQSKKRTQQQPPPPPPTRPQL